MKKVRSVNEAVETLLAYSPFDMKGKYTLERMVQLLEFLGDPQEKFRTIHIAGTSGKTSTSYFIRGMLEAASIRTGLTVSPHIIAVNERVQIGGGPLEEQKFLGYLNEFLELISTTELQPTYFELLIALAYWVFAKEGVEYAVVETGLGGLLDATNTISRQDKVCVITNIGLDHTEILGETIEEIAAQKAGIIQPSNHVIVRGQADSVMRVFIAVAQSKGADLEVVTSTEAPSLLPEFQHQNWAMAYAAYEYVKDRDGLQELGEQQWESIAHQVPPGRGEVYRIGARTLILDGAHNPQKLEALLGSLRAQGITSAAVLANFVQSPDTKLKTSIGLLLPFASHWIATTFSGGQDLKSRHSFALDYVASQAPGTSLELIMDPREALHALLARSEGVLLVTGSLYLVSLLRPEILKLQGK